MGSFLLIKSLLLAACTLGLEAAHENELLYSFREFLNNLPNQDHFYTDGVVLNIGNMDNNKHNIEVHLHASRIDPKTTKLVKCTVTVHRESDGTIQINSESGYKCVDDVITPKYQNKSDVRMKRQIEKEEDPTELKYQELADKALQKYIREKHIQSGPYLRAHVYRVRKLYYIPNQILRIDFDVDSIKNSYEHYVCRVDSGKLQIVEKYTDVSCEPRFTGLIHHSHH